MYAVCIIFSKANTACIDEVHSWMWSNRLQLNVNKSELLSATARRQHQLPTCTIRIGPDTITPSTAVRDLGIYIDSHLSTQTHVQRSVSQSVSQSINQSINHAFNQSISLSQAALQSCTSYAAFGVWFRRLCISHWSLPLFYHGWITVMRHWLANRPICLTVSSPVCPQRGSPDYCLTSALEAYYEHPSAVSSSWQLSSTGLYMALHLSTYQISCSSLPIC